MMMPQKGCKMEALLLKASEYAVQLINETRKERGIAPLEHDATLAKAALQHAEEMASGPYLSHWSQNGDKPYHRYFRAGFRDHIVENIQGFDQPEDTPNNEPAVIRIVEDVHQAFLSQETPHDNDLQNILNPMHTHVGVGLSIIRGHVRYVEAYADRYAAPSESLMLQTHGGIEDEEDNTTFTLEGTVFQYQDFGPFAAVVYKDDHPGPLSLDDLTGSYSGTAYTDTPASQAAVAWPWDITYDRSTGGFRVPVRIARVQEAVTYYVVLYVKPDPSGIPYHSYADGVDINGVDVRPGATWVLNLPDYTLAAGRTLRYAQLVSEDDLFSQSSSRNMEEEMAKTFARTQLAAQERDPISVIEVAVGPGHLTPPEGLEHNLFMPLERQERVSAYNLSLWVGRGGRTVIDGIMVMATEDDDEPQVPPGYEPVGEDIALNPERSTRLNEVHAHVYVKRVDRDDAEAPIVDLMLVHGTPGFVIGNAYDTVPFPEALASVFQANLFLGVKRKGAAARLLAQHEGRILEQVPEDRSVEAGLEAARANDDTATEAPGDNESSLHHSMTPEEIAEAERSRYAEAQGRAVQQQIEAEQKRQRQAVEELRLSLKDKERQRDRLAREQTELHRKLAALLANTKQKEGVPGGGVVTQIQEAAKEKDAASAAESERQYAETLNVIMDMSRRIRRQVDEGEIVAGELQYRLNDKQIKAEEIAASFTAFKREIALTSENSRTGKPIPEKVVTAFEVMEGRKTDEMQRVRLKNIALRMQLRKLESSLRAKEQLAEGLHLIDFEQLKIENQTLSEKIEERNEELQKLRKKNTVTVQVLTHVKEKLQFVAAENADIRERLGSIDSDLGYERDRLRRAKKDRDALRSENTKTRQSQGFSSSDLLVVDFEQRKEALELLRTELTDLKASHKILSKQAHTPTGH